MNADNERETGARREIKDAPSLLALAHPTRLALLEAIGLAGTMTATQASTVVGESPTACAYHLRVLASRGFIEEAGGGHGRQRPWRLVPTTQISIEDDPRDPVLAKATAALSKTVVEKIFAGIRRFELNRSRYPREVREVTGIAQSIAFATPRELGQLRAELQELISRYVDRLDPERRPPGSYPFEIVAFIHVLGAPDAQPHADT